MSSPHSLLVVSRRQAIRDLVRRPIHLTSAAAAAEPR